MNKKEQHITELSARLKPLTCAQIKYGTDRCEKFAYSYRKVIRCSECGQKINVQKGEILFHKIQNKEKLKCTSCGTTLNRIYAYRPKTIGFYYGVVQNMEEYNIVRHFTIEKNAIPGDKPKYNVYECVQNWIDSKGNEKVIARKIRMYSYDDWMEYSPMTLKRCVESYYGYSRYNISDYVLYKNIALTDNLKKIGIKSSFYGANASESIKYIIKNKNAEKLLKMGQNKMFAYSVVRNAEKYMNMIRICTKHGYTINNPADWIDYVNNLEELGKDVHNPVFICPKDLKDAHRTVLKAVNKKREKERRMKDLENIRKNEDQYRKQKGMYFGLAIIGEGITITVLKSVQEFFEEGTAMHHCVYTNGYYKQKDSLIMSAKDEKGDRLETVEIDLKHMKIMQSRAVCNGVSKKHDEILALINNNMNEIKRLK